MRPAAPRGLPRRRPSCCLLLSSSHRRLLQGRLRQGILDWKYKFFPNGTFEKLDTSPADPAYLPSFPGVPKIFMVGLQARSRSDERRRASAPMIRGGHACELSHACPLQNAPMEFANVGALMLNGLNNSGRLEIFGESSMTRRTASTGIDLIVRFPHAPQRTHARGALV